MLVLSAALVVLPALAVVVLPARVLSAALVALAAPVLSAPFIALLFRTPVTGGALFEVADAFFLVFGTNLGGCALSEVERLCA